MIRKLLARIRDYFGFSKVETHGTLVLLLLMALLLLSPLLRGLVFPAPEFVSAEDQVRLDSLVALLPLPVDKTTTESRSPTTSSYTPRQAERFAFDPNTADEDTLERLGFPTWLAERLIKYRNAGGKFRVKSDLKRLYGFSESRYQELESYIQLPAQEAPRQAEIQPARVYASQRRGYAPLQPFDANTADTVQWKRVLGIGSGYARRIVKFREGLGGFVSVAQLHEVYGLPDSVKASLDTLVFVTTDYKPQPLFINSVDAETLATHPYLQARSARALIAYRDQHGAFTEASFKEVRALSEDERARLLPYLNFQE